MLLNASVPDAQAFVLEVEREGVLAGCERLLAVPLDPLEIDEVPTRSLPRSRFPRAVPRAWADGLDQRIQGNWRCEVCAVALPLRTHAKTARSL